MDSKLTIWERMKKGGDLSGLKEELVNGRLDMRGLKLAEPSLVNVTKIEGLDAGELTWYTELERFHWTSIDFAGATLPSLRFLYGIIEDCVFDDCVLADLRIWATRLENVSFRGADMRGAALGTMEDGYCDTYVNVDFTQADLRRAFSHKSTFTNCIFRNTRLRKVEFWGSNFIDCVFEGELREVIFARDAWPPGEFPPNEMINVDLRKSRFWLTDFRKLNLDRVLFPEDDDHFVIDQFPQTVARVISVIESRTETGWLGIRALREHELQWAGARQRFGVWRKTEIASDVGTDGLQEILDLLRSWGVLRTTQEVNAMDPKDRLLP
ncbi:MAG: pentapeptide repeat-containing protein [Armatimonadetes bacterium]|nr:pentapeptide repeat-containing protein [Armatimonadota bacterium]